MKRYPLGLALLGLSVVLWLQNSVAGSAQGPSTPAGPTAGSPALAGVPYQNTSWVWRNPVPQGRTLWAIRFRPGGLGWAVGHGGTILHTRDGGAAWEGQTSGTSAPLFDVWFIDDHTGWAVGANGLILHTTDRGASWLPQTSGSLGTEDLVQVGFVDRQTGWLLRSSGTLLLTKNGG